MDVIGAALFTHVQPCGTVVAELTFHIRMMFHPASRKRVWSVAGFLRADGACYSLNAKESMAKRAIKVAVRNVVKVTTVHPSGTASRKSSVPAPAGPLGGQSEMLVGVAWDGGRQVWLVRPAPAVPQT